MIIEFVLVLGKHIDLICRERFFVGVQNVPKLPGYESIWQTKVRLSEHNAEYHSPSSRISTQSMEKGSPGAQCSYDPSLKDAHWENINFLNYSYEWKQTYPEHKLNFDLWLVTDQNNRCLFDNITQCETIEITYVTWVS
jgi:hypothetical protein